MLSIASAMNGRQYSAEKAYFFAPTSYRRYDWSTDTLDDGGSLPLWAWHLPDNFCTGFDAALAGAGKFDGFSYFFKDDGYVAYNWRSNRVDADSALIGPSWKLPSPFTANINTAVAGAGQYLDKAYFFKDNVYARYDWNTDACDLTAPLSAWNLPEDFASGVDAVVNGSGPHAGKAYFFKGERFVRYDWASGTVDTGYPQHIETGWPALAGINDPPQRRVVLYITIDPADHHAADGSAGGHGGNFTRLQAVARGWDAGLFVDDFWAPTVGDAIRMDPHVLAFVMSGSFSEWVEAFRQTAWAAQLDAISSMIRTTNVPMLAVCGSHQLVAYAYGGWSAVGHMASNGSAPEPIAHEADATFRAPNPRSGEVGVFKFRSEGPDPLLLGLPDSMYFVEYHHDQVLDVPGPLAVSLLAPQGVDDADQSAPYDMNTVVTPGATPQTFRHQPIANAQDRCRVQALAYHVDPAGRILYTTQFHPELTWSGVDPQSTAAGDHGRVMLQNFLNLARGFW
jgi:GMP synthase-like glutamine amidotransferase